MKKSFAGADLVVTSCIERIFTHEREGSAFDSTREIQIADMLLGAMPAVVFALPRGGLQSLSCVRSRAGSDGPLRQITVGTRDLLSARSGTTVWDGLQNRTTRRAPTVMGVLAADRRRVRVRAASRCSRPFERCKRSERRTRTTP